MTFRDKPKAPIDCEHVNNGVIVARKNIMERGAKVSVDFNAELHARPSIYFDGPAFVEHVAIMPQESEYVAHHGFHDTRSDDENISVRVERHTEFVTITRVTKTEKEAEAWPLSQISESDLATLTGIHQPKIVCRIGILVVGKAPAEISPILSDYEFADATASSIGGGSALICSDFRVRSNQGSRILLFNNDLNAHRLGRMVRRIFEIETYRSMALLGLPEAHRLSLLIAAYDRKLVELTNQNLITPSDGHKQLLGEITVLSAQIISASAQTRNRFGATSAYATIVEERIALLRETHVPGFQRFGTFVERRFKPAVRTCAAAALPIGAVVTGHHSPDQFAPDPDPGGN